jgi:hypothetical protein
VSISTVQQAPPRHRIISLEVLCLVLLTALLAQGPLTALLNAPALRTEATSSWPRCFVPL